MTTTDPRLVVYTCITGGYDDALAVRMPEDGVRYVCFTDGPVAGGQGWEVRSLPRSDLDPVGANRYVKMHPHLLFPEHAHSLYVDGNVELKAGVRAFAEEALRSHGMAVFAHPQRDCLYAEGRTCAYFGYGWSWAYHAQFSRYRREGLPDHAGLFECNILARAHHDAAVVALMEAWWGEFQAGVKRDQISLPYLVWKQGPPVNVLPRTRLRVDDPRFHLHIGHKPATWGRRVRGLCNLLLPHFWLLGRGARPGG